MLTGSRFLAGLLYASLSVSVVSKCYASRAYLHHSWLGTVLDFEPAHDLHTCELIWLLSAAALVLLSVSGIIILKVVEVLLTMLWWLLLLTVAVAMWVMVVLPSQSNLTHFTYIMFHVMCSTWTDGASFRACVWGHFFFYRRSARK